METIQLVKLRGNENWTLWKFQIKILLSSKELFEVVNGNEKRPPTDEAKVNQWNKKDIKSQEIIVSRLEEGPMTHILTCQSSHEMWKKLLSVYEMKSEVSLHLVQQKFFNYSYSGDGISTHVSKLEEIVSQLKQLGTEISEQMLITKVLMSLPSQYNYFVSAWESVPAEKQTINDLTSRLLIEEERMKKMEVPEMNNTAFTARKIICYRCSKVGHKQAECRSRMENRKKELFCNYCRKPGHEFKFCYFRQGKFQGNKRKPNDSTKKALVGEKQNKEETFLKIITSEEFKRSTKENKWILDTGASDHMSNQRSVMTNYTEFENPTQIKIGDGTLIKAKGFGDINAEAFNGDKWEPVVIKDVLFVPELSFNLFSAGKALDKDLKMDSNKFRCLFKKNEEIYAIGVRNENLYQMLLRPATCSEANLGKTVKRENLTIWHEKFGHQNLCQTRRILSKFNIPFEDTKDFQCEACIKGKQHKLPFSLSNSIASKPGEIIHIDVCGPMETASLANSKYFVLFKDDFSHYRTVYFLKTKNEVSRKLNVFLNRTENETGCRVKIIRSDNGTEIINQDVQEILDNNGVAHQRTVPYTPEQNGRCEREMRTVVEMARTMLHAKNLETELWAEAVNYAVTILNSVGTSSVKDKTPHELWFNCVSDVKKLKIFGGVFIHIPKQKRRKWDAKSKKGFFVGYSEGVKGFRVYVPEERNIEVARDVIFEDTESFIKTPKTLTLKTKKKLKTHKKIRMKFKNKNL